MIEGIKTLKVTITGLTPLVMKSSQTVDPDNEYAAAMKKISAKGAKKTPADREKLRWLDWRGGLYWDDELGVYAPSSWIEGTVRDGARKFRKGKDVIAGLVCLDDVIPLEYGKKAKTPEALYTQTGAVDWRYIVIGRVKVMRARPRFDTWSLTFRVQIVTEVVSVESVKDALMKAGLVCGVGDYRPKFGRFAVTSFEEVKA